MCFISFPFYSIFICNLQISTGESYTYKDYYYPTVSDDESLPQPQPKPVRKSEAKKRANNIDIFFEKPKKKQATGLTSTVAQSTAGGTNYLASSVVDIPKATHLIKIDVYELKKLRSLPTDQHWKHADVRVKYYTHTEDDDLHTNAKDLIYKITKQIAEESECRKYFISAAK